MRHDAPSIGDIVRGLLRVIFSAAAALLVVALLLYVAYRVLIAPARDSRYIATGNDGVQVQGGWRGVVAKLYLDANRSALEPVSDDADANPVAFDVVAGETAEDVALRLQNLDLIRDASAFKMLLQYYGIDTQIEAGRFQFSPAMHSEEIAQALRHASANETVLVTLEGWRLEQEAQAVEMAFGDGQGFQQAAAGTAVAIPAWVGAPAGTRSLEGLLFPNTYRLDPEAGGADVAAAMLAEFEAQFDEDRRQRAEEVGLTPYQVLILASIVEREAVIAEERPLIAAAFLNRVHQGMRLEADPTVQYALGYQAGTDRWWKVPLLAVDITDTASPYNTYLSDGMPPGPICNPGLASIDAVLWPADVDYLYFMAKGDGSHAFTASFDEHLANVAKYQEG
ncbi:MAG: endolytic transglycosylase MltG [Anaerolineae bacterium]